MNAPRDFRAMTASTIGADLLGALLQELKLLPKPWDQLSAAKQDDVIERLRNRVDSNIKMAVHLIASEGRTVVTGDLDKITIKDGAQAVIKVGRGAPSLHELYEAQGKAVLIVVADAAAHTGGMDEIQGEADQRGLDLGHEYRDDDGGGMEEAKEEAGITIISESMLTYRPSERDLQEAYGDGWCAAEAGHGQDACPNEHGDLCIAWIKGWKANQGYDDNVVDAEFVDPFEGDQGDTEPIELIDDAPADAEAPDGLGQTENHGTLENPITQTELEAAYDAGYDAAAAGQSDSECPHQWGLLRGRWMDGHNEWRNQQQDTGKKPHKKK
ncbi:ribosome modulation factor [Chitinimonas lacunae]|uniref:Ribosome modulation factor n=1 Tax=Chitinimonas lacunae TaxID=1963018 RepID=A0ABV8MW14_9NEIS